MHRSTRLNTRPTQTLMQRSLLACALGLMLMPGAQAAKSLDSVLPSAWQLQSPAASFELQAKPALAAPAASASADGSPANFVVATDAPAAPVPEPQGWALLLAGVAALGVASRRRRVG